jgi:hypothetical protein
MSEFLSCDAHQAFALSTPLTPLPSAFEALRETPEYRMFCTSHYASWRWHMTRLISRPKLQKTIALAIATIVLALGTGSRSLAQISPDNNSPAPIQQSPSVISADDLSNLVAPIALYPDALLAQVLVACTYPLEVVEATQWLQQNKNLPNRELLAAAQQQNWDPSVQALVAFPDVLARLNQNIRWTTDLGNAFLAQQADVMTAVQTLRAQARENGQLRSTPQLAVNTEVQGEVQSNAVQGGVQGEVQGYGVQGDPSPIVIQPANPQIIYVPSYNPSVVWGAPAEGSYPALSYEGSGFGSLFGTIANLAGFLPGFQGLLGVRSWGWALSWLAQALFVNNSFFNDFGFSNSWGGNSNAGYGQSSLWAHNTNHRRGVPYGNNLVASRYGAGRYGGGSRPRDDGWRSFGSGTRGISASEHRQPFNPRPSAANQSFQRGSRPDFRTERPGNQRTFTTNPRTPGSNPRTPTQSARTFSPPSHTTARTNAQINARTNPRTNDRGLQSIRSTGRDSRAHSFPGKRSFSDSRSLASSHDSFANRGSTPSSRRSPEPARTAKSSSWGHMPHFSKAHMSHGDSSQHSFSQHAPKQKHFSEPKFKAPKAPKSHGGGGGHASRGHGSKSHHG